MELSIDVGITGKDIYPSTLQLGGHNPKGDRISFTNYYMELNGRPYFAICGEFHYSRYPEANWETEIRKMKMSGINVIATYIFWNHHEEIEGNYNWQGNMNLHKFIRLCGENGLYIILRIGPFCHGEVRNGGLPDWLFGRTFDVRSNDEGYLMYVNRLYEEIGRQSAGLLFKDGGPVIGIQLENEFNAASALWELTAKQGDEYLSGGSGGAEHMRRLKQLAVGAGLVAPIYTSTGWGSAPVLEDEVLPLYGGYAYTPWSISEQNPHQKPTHEYLFESYHDQLAVTGTFNPPYPKDKYPFACCEMGGGMQTWYLSRFQVEPESVMAMSLMKIAGGCNFIGYYMFHGGTNPVGRTGYLNESTTPKITYDFQAPIGEFGQIRESNDRLRPLHYFLRRFGGRLAPMGTVLPEGAEAIRPEDTESLRYAVRTDGKAGFLFINNYQDHVEMVTHEDIRFTVKLSDETIRFPGNRPLTIQKNAAMMLPFNFTMDGLNLRYATAQPVTVMESEEAVTYFFLMPDSVDGEFVMDEAGIARIGTDAGAVEKRDGEYCMIIPYDTSAVIRITRNEGRELRIYAMTSRQAAMMWEAEIGGRTRILFSETPLALHEDGIDFSSSGKHSFSFWEYTGGVASMEQWRSDSASCSIMAHQDELFCSYHVSIPEENIDLVIERIHDHKIVLRFDTAVLESVDDVLLKIDYTGNVGYAFSGGELFHDHFYNGSSWEIGLSRFKEIIQTGEIVLETTPLRRGTVTVAADAAMAAEQLFAGEQQAKFHSITAEPIYRITLQGESVTVR